MAVSEVEQALAFQLRAAKIGGWKREVEWHPKRRWRSDFCFREERVLIEVEGGQSTPGGGRHQRSGGFELDAEKYNAAAILGWTVLRFTSRMVMDGRALSCIERMLERRRTASLREAGR